MIRLPALGLANPPRLPWSIQTDLSIIHPSWLLFLATLFHESIGQSPPLAVVNPSIKLRLRLRLRLRLNRTARRLPDHSSTLACIFALFVLSEMMLLPVACPCARPAADGCGSWPRPPAPRSHYSDSSSSPMPGGRSTVRPKQTPSSWFLHRFICIKRCVPSLHALRRP
ncbi:hypothetical protein BKA80DRAFT_66039 [Phyllosticta citrichinensis]